MTSNIDPFSQGLFNTQGDTQGSFIEKQIDLSAEELEHILDDLDCGNFIHSSTMPSRKLTFIFNNNNEVEVFLGKKLPTNKIADSKSITDDFFLFIVQTTLGVFLLVASTFDYQSHLTEEAFRNPFQDEDMLNNLADKIKVKLGVDNAIFWGDGINVAEVEKEQQQFHFISFHL